MKLFYSPFDLGKQENKFKIKLLCGRNLRKQRTIYLIHHQRQNQLIPGWLWLFSWGCIDVLEGEIGELTGTWDGQDAPRLPDTRTPSKGFFSRSKFIIGPQQASLAPLSVEILVCLKEWYHIFGAIFSPKISSTVGNPIRIDDYGEGKFSSFHFSLLHHCLTFFFFTFFTNLNLVLLFSLCQPILSTILKSISLVTTSPIKPAGMLVQTTPRGIRFGDQDE